MTEEQEMLADALDGVELRLREAVQLLVEPAKCVGAPFSLGTAVRLENARGLAMAAHGLVEEIREYLDEVGLE